MSRVSPAVGEECADVDSCLTLWGRSVSSSEVATHFFLCGNTKGIPDCLILGGLCAPLSRGGGSVVIYL